jgi:hypothetical protein
MKMKDFFESFDSDLPVDWTTSGNSETGFFSLDERNYKIELVHTDIKELNKGFDVLIECSFLGRDGNNPNSSYSYAASATQNATHSATVFGTVMNATRKRIKLNDTTILYFAAKKNDNSFESRRRMYQTLARTLAKRLDVQWAHKVSSDFEIFFLSKKSIPQAEIEQIVELIIG